MDYITWDMIWSAGLLLIGILICIGLFFYTKTSNYQYGRRAYHDGLRFNPKWGKDICKGWKDARDDDDA